jgi:glycosyltransferase involved in cell wall biosynthesis
MSRVTVLLGSSRPGGIDVSLLGLAAQTYDDFELIFVDARYHQRHALVLDMVASSGLKVPFFHVPNHRYGEGPWTTISAGFNTGFMLAAGEIVLMLCDYAYAPPGWISTHLAHHTEPRMVVAPHRYRAIPPVKNDFAVEYPTGTIFVEPFAPITVETVFDMPPQSQEINDTKLTMLTGPVNHLYMHTKNESFPLANVLAIGGCDENYDRGRGPGDHCLGHRLIDSGLQGWLAGDAVVEVLNPRGIMPNPNIAIADEKLPPPNEHRWTVAEGNVYYHATFGRKTANNPYSLADRKKEIWHWRELSQNREAVIPKRVIPDSAYFAECEFRYP